jgi:hypothetical protein
MVAVGEPVGSPETAAWSVHSAQTVITGHIAGHCPSTGTRGQADQIRAERASPLPFGGTLCFHGLHRISAEDECSRMPMPNRGDKYEVVVEAKGRSGIDGVFDDEASALERAKYLLTQAKFSLVQVSRVNKAGREDIIFQKGSGGGGKVTSISHIDEANVCTDALQVYSFASRSTLLRLLRAYWDEQQVIPAEQLHRYYPLRYLEREAVLFNPALARLAALQAPALGVSPFERQDQLVLLYKRIKELAQDDAPLAGCDRALTGGGIAGLLGAAREIPPDQTDRIVTHAFAQVLEPQREWGAKLGAVLRFLDEGNPDSVRLCDEFAAEIVNGREPIRSLIGYSPDLGTALLSLIATLCGTLDDRFPHTEPLLALSDAVGAGGMTHVETALLERIVGGLDGNTPLTRGTSADEARVLHAILERLSADDGYRGGVAMAAALTKRAKVAFGTGGEDRSFDDTVQRLMLRLPTPAARVGYLLDLAASPFGRRRLSLLIELVADIFGGVRSVGELAPTGMPARDARERFGERLKAAGIPRALANALIVRMGTLPDHPPTLTRETIQLRGEKPAALPRLALTLGERTVVLPDATRRAVIGRSKTCDLVIDVPSASREHAAVEWADGHFVLTDTSRNGTLVRPEHGVERTLAKGESQTLERRGVLIVGWDSEDPPPARIHWSVDLP